MIMLIAAVVGLAFGAVAEFEANGRNWAGWGVIALALGHILSNLNS